MNWTEIEFPSVKRLMKDRWRVWLWPVPFFHGFNWCICILKRTPTPTERK